MMSRPTGIKESVQPGRRLPAPSICSAWALYLLINSLFVVKYAARASQSVAIAACSVYVVGITLFFVLLRRWRQPSPLLVGCIIVGLVGILLIAQSMLDPYQLQVDRWSAIHNFLYNLFHGVYPYAARTHLGGYGSPFPVWQLFHIPFYLLGNVGLSVFFCLGLFLVSLPHKQDSSRLLLAALLILLSPAFVYEVLVRSDLMANFLLVAAILNGFARKHISLKNHWLCIAVAVGLLMSTRLTTVVAFTLWLLPDYLRQPWKIKLLMPLVAMAVFALTFLPLLFWDADMLLFFRNNPFVLQTRQGSPWEYPLVLPLLLVLALTWKNSWPKLMMNISWALFALVVITFVCKMYFTNTWTGLFTGHYDITYFNMALPFVTIVLSELSTRGR